MNQATAELIYWKTEAGLREMRERVRNLPRKTFLLLLAIDGQRSRHQLCSTLSAFGDVAAQLQVLQAAGLIEVRNVPAVRRAPTSLIEAHAVEGDDDLALDLPAANDAVVDDRAARDGASDSDRPPPARDGERALTAGNGPFSAGADLKIDAVFGPVIGALFVTPPLPMPKAQGAGDGPNVNDYGYREIDRQRLPRLQAMMAEHLIHIDDPQSIDLLLAIEQAQDVTALRRLIPDYASAIASLLTHDEFQAHTSTLLALATDSADLLAR